MMLAHKFELGYSLSLFLVVLFIYLYFWLCCIFVALCGLSLAAVSVVHSSLRCMDLSLWWLLMLPSTGFKMHRF